MKTTILALAVLFAACGPDNMPPEVVKAIPEQRISVSDTARVTAADHFADPEGGSLAYAASSSASGVVTATMDGGEIVLVALDAGEAEITVTATDSVEAATEQTFAAHALNDPPMVVEALPDLALVVGGHATDPTWTATSPIRTGDALTYSAASSNPAAGVVVEGSILTVVAQSEGTAEVEALATDPDGEFATSAFSVVVEEVSGFWSDWDSGDLDGWIEVGDVDMMGVDNGLLFVLLYYDAEEGWAERMSDTTLDSIWSVEVEMGTSTDTGKICPAIHILTDHEDFTGYMLRTDTDADKEGYWEIGVMYEDEFHSILGQRDDEVNQLPGEFTTFRLEMVYPRLTIKANDHVIFNEELDENDLPIDGDPPSTATGLQIGGQLCSGPGELADILFDWAGLRGRRQ